MKRLLSIVIVLMFMAIMIMNNKDSVEICWENGKIDGTYKNELQEFLIKNVSEISTYAKYIDEMSGGEAHLVIHIYKEVEIAKGEKGDKEKYYPVYVGEQWNDHRVNWDWFYVHKELNEIYWYDLIEDELILLEEWRYSDKYRKM